MKDEETVLKKNDSVYTINRLFNHRDFYMI